MNPARVPCALPRTIPHRGRRYVETTKRSPPGDGYVLAPQPIGFGRAPDQLKILASINPIAGETADAAEEKFQSLQAKVHPDVGRVMTTLDLSAVDERSFVIVGTQGHYDEEALERALDRVYPANHS